MIGPARATRVHLEPDALALFVAFVRMNPTIEADDPMLIPVLQAYNRTVRAMARETGTP
jgi:hypothetical protein